MIPASSLDRVPLNCIRKNRSRFAHLHKRDILCLVKHSIFDSIQTSHAAERNINDLFTQFLVSYFPLNRMP